MIIDNACTKSILGRNAVKYIVDQLEDVPIVIRTENGESTVSRKGAVFTAYGVVEGGY